MTTLAILSVLLTAPRLQDVTTPPDGSKTRKACMDALRAKLKKSLRGKPVVFKVDQLNQLGDWIFMKGDLKKPNGDDFDYHGTVYQDDIDHDMVGGGVYALFHRERGSWKVKTYVVGPTDVAYATWARDYGAPRAIIPYNE